MADSSNRSSRRRPAHAAASTLQLLVKIRAGDEDALNTLLLRYGPALVRWARGRLPRWARDVMDTPDIVQETLLKSFKKLGTFEYRGEGALHAYLRQSVNNRIRDELRRVQRRAPHDSVDESLLDQSPSPLETVIGRRSMERYEAALAELSDADREALIGRLEFGFTYGELAQALGKQTPEAARKQVTRAMVNLTKLLKNDGRADEDC